jgi:hypothetical protein
MSQRATAPGGSSIGNSASVIFGDPDIPCFLLLDDSANELFLCILTPDWRIFLMRVVGS